jgi:hypothetical protein
MGARIGVLAHLLVAVVLPQWGCDDATGEDQPTATTDGGTAQDADAGDLKLPDAEMDAAQPAPDSGSNAEDASPDGAVDGGQSDAEPPSDGGVDPSGPECLTDDDCHTREECHYGQCYDRYCHIDCFAEYRCRDGVLYAYEDEVIWCWDWDHLGWRCPYWQVGTCENGCDPTKHSAFYDPWHPESSDDPQTLCAE